MAALVVIALGSVSCGQTSPEGHPNDAPKPLVLTRGIGGQPGSLDPQRAEDAFSYDVASGGVRKLKTRKAVGRFAMCRVKNAS